jgi:hypothetical protein
VTKELMAAIDPAAELIRAALAWSERSPSIGEAHANLKHAAELYRLANQPDREERRDGHERD